MEIGWTGNGGKRHDVGPLATVLQWRPIKAVEIMGCTSSPLQVDGEAQIFVTQLFNED